MIENKLEEVLIENFDCDKLEVVNESHLHAGHAGSPETGQSHFSVVLVSQNFENKNRVQRHQMVNNVVKSLFDKGLHALSLKLFTPKEYISKIKG